VNTADLRRDLMADLKSLREGKLTNASIRARAIMARTILQSISVEISAAQLGRHFDPVEIGETNPNLKQVA
jgi:hypothetical protein